MFGGELRPRCWVWRGRLWYGGAWQHATYVLHPEKRHNGECADGQKTAAVAIATGAFVCGSRGEENVSWLEGGVEILSAPPPSL